MPRVFPFDGGGFVSAAEAGADAAAAAHTGVAAADHVVVSQFPARKRAHNKHFALYTTTT